MNISELVHSFYAPDSNEPQVLRTLLFLDFDPVLPGWPPEHFELQRDPDTRRWPGDGVFDTSNNNVRRAFQPRA